MNTRMMLSDISERLDKFFAEFDQVCGRSGRDAEDISLVLATKYLDETSLRELFYVIRKYQNRSISIGENRIQDAEKKFDSIKTIHPGLLVSVKKIMIGTLQKNKVSKALELFDEIHSIDSLELAECIDERFAGIAKPMDVFLQINISGEANKHGIPLNDADNAIEHLNNRANIKLSGLMTMAPFTSDEHLIRSVFRSLRQLAYRHNLKTSMGMSNDWKIAVEEGSDILRIGSVLFE